MRKVNKTCVPFGLLLIIYFSLLPFADAQHASPVDSLSELVKRDKSDTNKISHLNRLGWELMYSNPDTSIILSKQAEALALSILNSEAVQSNEKLSKATKSRLGQTYNCLGVFYWFISDYPTSILYHQRSLAIRRLLGDRKNEGTSLSNLGLVYKAKGDFNQALKNYFAALSIAIEFKNPASISTYLSNLGTVYHDMGEHKRALDFYFASIPLYKKVDDMIGLSMAYAYIANAYVELNDLNKALNYFDRALTISRSMDNIYLESFQLNNSGEVYMKQHKLMEGMECFHKALPMAEKIGELSLVATIKMNLGMAHLEMNKFNEAKMYLIDGLKISEDIQAYPNIEIASKELSMLFARTNNFKEAYAYQNKYIAAHDTIYNQIKTKEFGQVETRHEMALEARERQRSEEERLRQIKYKRNRAELLQISGIVLICFLVAAIIVMLGFKKVNARVANAITFFSTLILFEFCLVLIDPWVDRVTGGLPAYKLIMNASVALLIFPVHSGFVKLLKRRITK